MKYKIEYKPREKDFEDAFYIEEKYFESSTIASVGQVIKWDMKNNDIHVFIRDEEINKIVGEMTLLPLSEEQFNKFMINELEDTEINSEILLSYKRNQSYYLLFSAIAIDPKYINDRMILSLLLKGLSDKIRYLQNKNIKFLNMCAEGQTLEGQNFIENFLDLKYRRDTKEGYKLYSFDSTKDFDDWLVKLPKYIESYNNKFNLKY